MASISPVTMKPKTTCTSQVKTTAPYLFVLDHLKPSAKLGLSVTTPNHQHIPSTAEAIYTKIPPPLPPPKKPKKLTFVCAANPCHLTAVSSVLGKQFSNSRNKSGSTTARLISAMVSSTSSTMNVLQSGSGRCIGSMLRPLESGPWFRSTAQDVNSGQSRCNSLGGAAGATSPVRIGGGHCARDRVGLGGAAATGATTAAAAAAATTNRNGTAMRLVANVVDLVLSILFGGDA
ncbi:uncharacterized protein PgNI_08614 [Pyricularia grisea]|uniref:Uncharacterized protein n=1 Tax=Pyricularia grisea TaxID=148305 RepID=A0A6P8AWM0_PYRGI|nr:uncharacterized protein PgNI_08614 [Pyricularia grisea]TLD06618.1 hypothetical protein PgNI_08614 [Pyricularia grisea]